jgi:hypothetical protein
MADRTARLLMVGECARAFPKVMKFWLEAIFTRAVPTVSISSRANGALGEQRPKG